jgi:hypothetical protein
MRSWTLEVLRRTQGGVPSTPEDGDWPSVPAPTEANWRAAQLSLVAAHEALAACVRDLGERELDERVKDRPGETPGTGIRIRGMIRSLGEHDIYHTGQLAMLKRHARGAH